MESYAISDTHFGHAKVLLPSYDGRPFGCIQDHDDTILANCLDILRPGDVLRHLGDVAMNVQSAIPFLSAMSKHGVSVRLILGNHDDHLFKYLRNNTSGVRVQWVGHADYFKYGGHKFYALHYACRTWRASHHGSLHIHGHSHGALPGYGRSMDVGVNVIGYKPISLDEIIERLSAKPITDHHEKQVSSQ